MLQPLDAASRGARLLPEVVRRPSLFGRWLARAHAAWLFALAFALFVWAGLPALSEGLADRYPPIVTEKSRLFGLLERKESRPDPRLAIRRRQLEGVVWASGIAGLAVLLLAALPAAVSAGTSAPASAPARRPSEAALRPAEVSFDPESGADSRTLPLPAAEAADAGVLVSPRYRRFEEIGRGGMGVVYRAHDLELDRAVALKVLPFHAGDRPEVTRRFRQEARLLARLGHPNVVNVYDFFEADARLWMVLELVRGGNLADEMKRWGGTVPVRRALGFARQIAQGLAHAHGQGIVHRDVKPTNVLLMPEPDPIAKLTDFGIAKLSDATPHTQAGTLIGSARYMSPELAAGEAGDERADAYALGVTIFELIAGRAPFEGEVRSILARQISEPAPPLREHAPAAPKALESLVARLLAKHPEERPAAMASVAAELADLERGSDPA